MVSLRPLPSSSSMTVCTEPFPKVCVPSTTARPWSWSAPATPSEAQALPAFTRTTIGESGAVPGSRGFAPGGPRAGGPGGGEEGAPPGGNRARAGTRLTQGPPGVVAEVEDQARKLLAAVLGPEAVQLALQVGVG